MSGPPGCEGQGSGWGTLEGTSIRVLVLAAPDRSDMAEATRVAFSTTHKAIALAERPGFFPSLLAAKVGREHQPHVVHAIGAGGFAGAAPALAAGLGVPLIATLKLADLAHKRAVRRAIAQAAALIVTDAAAADALRAQGVSRELYVISEPDGKTPPAGYGGSLEIVYGRVLGAAGSELPEIEVERAEEALVQLGGLRRAKEQ